MRLRNPPQGLYPLEIGPHMGRYRKSKIKRQNIDQFHFTNKYYTNAGVILIIIIEDSYPNPTGLFSSI